MKKQKSKKTFRYHHYYICHCWVDFECEAKDEKEALKMYEDEEYKEIDNGSRDDGTLEDMDKKEKYVPWVEEI